MIYRYQGETIDIDIDVFDILGEEFDLTTATAEMTYNPVDDYDTVVTKDLTLSGGNISTTITALETSTLEGWYQYEIKVVDTNDKVAMIKVEKFHIKKSNNPTFGTT